MASVIDVAWKSSHSFPKRMKDVILLRGKTPQNGWFTMENPYENGDDLGGLLGGSCLFVCMYLVKLARDRKFTSFFNPKLVVIVREIPSFQGNLGWWNMMIWPDVSYLGGGFDTWCFVFTPMNRCWRACFSDGLVQPPTIDTNVLYNITHSIHGWCIYLHLLVFVQKCV